MDELISYKESLKTAWGFNDYNDWPIKFNSIMHLFIKEFGLEFVEDMDECLKVYSSAEVAEAFGNPSRLYRIIHSVLNGMKMGKVSLKEQRQVAGLMLSMVSDMKAGSIFNEDGKNIILKDYEEFENLPFEESSIEKSRNLHALFGMLWAYTESIFFRAHDVTKEIHGIYEQAGKKILIREYFNLRPESIWENIDFINYSTIKIITVYNSNLDVTLDAYNHVYFHGGNYHTDLLYFLIEADGRAITLKEFLEQKTKITATIGQIHEWAVKSDWKEKTNRYADIYWFRKKPLKDLTRKDWRVSEEVRNKIAGGTIDQRRIERMTERQIQFLVSTLL